MRADISDNMNQMIESIDGISENWEEIVLDEDLTDKCVTVLESVHSLAITIQLLLRFNAIWLTDSEHFALNDILSFSTTGIDELLSIDKESN